MSATSVPLQSVGRALARIGSLRSPQVDPASPGGDSRAAILEFIESAGDAVRVEDIAEAVGLHANTVRGHLDTLLASGRIHRTPDQRATRGRPHWLYAAASSATVRELSRALERELESASASDVARLAAATWAEIGPDVDPAATPDDAVDRATVALTEFGFDAVRNTVGDEITLRACPYADLVREHPVICDIHAQLLGEVLRRTEQPVRMASLDVFPRPGLCVAHLRRPDAQPEWVVPPPERTSGPATAHEPHAATPSRRKKK